MRLCSQCYQVQAHLLYSKSIHTEMSCLGKRNSDFIGKAADREDGGLVSQGTVFLGSWEFRLLAYCDKGGSGIKHSLVPVSLLVAVSVSSVLQSFIGEPGQDVSCISKQRPFLA